MKPQLFFLVILPILLILPFVSMKHAISSLLVFCNIFYQIKLKMGVTLCNKHSIRSFDALKNLLYQIKLKMKVKLRLWKTVGLYLMIKKKSMTFNEVFGRIRRKRRIFFQLCIKKWHWQTSKTLKLKKGNTEKRCSYNAN